MVCVVECFGGIDVLVNNVGVICLVGVEKLEFKCFDLMYQINICVVLVCSQVVLFYLCRSVNGYIFSLLLLINLVGRWFVQYGFYMVIKYGMSMFILGMYEEFGKYVISVNVLWLKIMIVIVVIEFELGSCDVFCCVCILVIMVDVVYVIFISEGCSFSGCLLVDEELLCECGQSDFEQYCYDLEGGVLVFDLFFD